jgi:hypothetical protein
MTIQGNACEESTSILGLDNDGNLLNLDVSRVYGELMGDVASPS